LGGFSPASLVMAGSGSPRAAGSRTRRLHPPAAYFSSGRLASFVSPVGHGFTLGLSIESPTKELTKVDGFPDKIVLIDRYLGRAVLLYWRDCVTWRPTLSLCLWRRKRFGLYLRTIGRKIMLWHTKTQSETDESVKRTYQNVKTITTSSRIISREKHNLGGLKLRHHVNPHQHNYFYLLDL
jgi:hypothetical protein